MANITYGNNFEILKTFLRFLTQNLIFCKNRLKIQENVLSKIALDIFSQCKDTAHDALST
jgi:hypothetical protein